MGIFITVGICALDVILAVFLMTFLYDMLENKIWKSFIILMIAVLLLNIWGMVMNL